MFQCHDSGFVMSPVSWSWPPSDADLALIIAARQWINTHGVPEAPYSSMGNPFLHAAETAFLNAAGEVLGEDWNTYKPSRVPVTEEEWERRRVTPDIRSRIFERDNYECQSWGAKDGLVEIDHVIPISRGGSSDDDNLQALCTPCNRSKGTKTLEEWGGRR